MMLLFLYAIRKCIKCIFVQKSLAHNGSSKSETLYVESMAIEVCLFYAYMIEHKKKKNILTLKFGNAKFTANRSATVLHLQKSTWTGCFFTMTQLNNILPIQKNHVILYIAFLIKIYCCTYDCSITWLAVFVF